MRYLTFLIFTAIFLAPSELSASYIFKGEFSKQTKRNVSAGKKRNVAGVNYIPRKHRPNSITYKEDRPVAYWRSLFTPSIIVYCHTPQLNPYREYLSAFKSNLDPHLFAFQKVWVVSPQHIDILEDVAVLSKWANFLFLSDKDNLVARKFDIKPNYTHEDKLQSDAYIIKNGRIAYFEILGLPFSDRVKDRWLKLKGKREDL